MLKPNLVVCLLLAGICCNLHAQDLQVHFDVFHDSLYLTKNGKAVSKATVRQGRNVVFLIENYNNYLYDVSLELQNEEPQTAAVNPEGGLRSLLPSGGGAINPLSMLFGGGGSEQLLGAFKMFPGLSGKDLKEGSGFGTSAEETQRLEKVAELKKAEREFEQLRDRIFTLDEQLGALEKEVETNIMSNRLQVFAASEIAQIRYNPHLEPRQIKKMSGEYMKKIFMEDDPGKLDLPQVLKIADSQAEVNRTVQQYILKTNQYAREADACKASVINFQRFNFPNSNLEQIITKSLDFSTAIQSKLSVYQANSERLNEKMAAFQPLDPGALITLRTTYLELYNNKFSKTFTQTASGERMKFKVKLSPLDSLQRQGIREKTMPLEVQVYGGLRVKASVGLSFGQFFTRPKEFFVRDSILQASTKDAFSPILTSFVHFFAPSDRSVFMAGSFGVGFPLSGGENLQAISFFIGPSLVFGKDQRIVLSTGLMGGKTDRLTQGYKTGDKFYSDSNNAPVTSVYNVGYFLGVSFNL